MSIILSQKHTVIVTFLALLFVYPVSAEKSRVQTRIPEANKPTMAFTYLENNWQGFPAILVQKAKMGLYFRNGNTVRCSNWDPTTLSPTPASVGRRIKGCKVNRGKPRGKRLRGFKKGATIDITFGNIGAVGNNWIASSSSRIYGSNLRMTRSGRIAIGKFRTSTMTRGGNSAHAVSKSRSIKGRYTLDGHTIIIKSNSGEMLYGFIGAQLSKGGNKIDHIFINGEHFWNRNRQLNS